MDSIVVLRAHLDKAHGIVLQDIIESQGGGIMQRVDTAF
jgi:hypothetical protein